MENVVHAFPDTNVYLHYPPLAQIDWRRLCNAAAVHLVICLQVIKELDAKKSDSRLAQRAERAIKEIREAHRSGAPISDGVTLSIFNQEIRLSDFSAVLSPDSGDDWIVQLARVYREQHQVVSVAIVTEDLGMELRCEAGGITAVPMDRSRRLENPADELTRKHRQVSQELNALKNRIPKLWLAVTNPGSEPRPKDHANLVISGDAHSVDIDGEMEQIRRKYPKLSVEEFKTEQVLGSNNIMWRMVPPNEWAAYNSKLDQYFEEYRVYLDNLATQRLVRSRCVSFSLWLMNDGTAPATDIDASVQLPPEVIWAAENDREAADLVQKDLPAPEAPSLPHLFGGMMVPAARHHYDAPAWVGVETSRLREMFLKANVTRSEDGSQEIRAHSKSVKHGHAECLGIFSVAFDDSVTTRVFEVEFTISCAELADKCTGTFPLFIQSKSAPVDD